MSTFENVLTSFEEVYGINHVEASNLLGVPYGTYCKWIYGTRRPSRMAINLFKRFYKEFTRSHGEDDELTVLINNLNASSLN